MLKWFPNDDYNNQISAIESWGQDIRVLQEMLRAGHADVHLFNDDIPIKDITQCINRISDIGTDARKVLADDRTLLLQITRVANEVVSASHFADNAVMFGALSTAFKEAAPEINRWLTGSLTGQRYHYLCLVVKMPGFIGSGIGVDGNERATNAVKIILEHSPCFVDGVRVPYRIQTAFPDISDQYDVGTVITTGHNFGFQLSRCIHRCDFYVRMYWALREHGVNVTMSNDRIPAAVMHAEVNGIQYSAFYSAKAVHDKCGYIFVSDLQQNKFLPVRYSGLSLLDASKIRNDETRRIGDCLQRAISRTQFAIASPETVFPAAPPAVVRCGSRVLAYDEASAYHDDPNNTLDKTA